MKRRPQADGAEGPPRGPRRGAEVTAARRRAILRPLPDARQERMIDSRAIAFMVFAVVCGAAPARAETAKPDKKPAASVVLQVTNARAVALTELDATPTGQFIPKAIVRNLAAGKKTTAKLATDKDCVFDLHGAYADGSSTESQGIDLCKDQTVKLVD